MLQSSLAVLGGKIDAVTETAQQLIDNQYYAAGDIQNSMDELKNKWVLFNTSKLWAFINRHIMDTFCV